MDHIIKLKNEIDHQKRLLEDCEAIMDQVPKHLKPYQEMALKLHRERIEKLEARLTSGDNWCSYINNPFYPKSNGNNNGLEET